MTRKLRCLLRVGVLTLMGLAWGVVQADVITYYHNDISGTPLAATDAQGNLLWKESYRPYGERWLKSAAGSSDNRLWFGGKPQEPDTGLSYLGARYYNPQLGRFMGMDPKGVNPDDLHSVNRYAYGNNNPYKFVDPNGKHPLLADVYWVVASMASGAAVSGGMNAAEQYATTGNVQWGGIGGVLDAAGDGALLGPVFGAAGFAARAGIGMGAAKGRVFTSADPLVGNLATKIDAAYPGHVVGVNVPIRDAAGRLVTDADILLKNGVVQVKSGGGKGLTSQLQRTEQATGLPTIGYGPDLKPSILCGCAATNCERTLIEVVKP